MREFFKAMRIAKDMEGAYELTFMQHQKEQDFKPVESRADLVSKWKNPLFECGLLINVENRRAYRIERADEVGEYVIYLAQDFDHVMEVFANDLPKAVDF